MSAQPSVDDNFTFVGGLNTEGGYFVTPKNSWVEGENVVPKIDGSVERRPAIAVENEGSPLFSFQSPASDIFNNVVCVEKWNSVGGDGNLDYFVVQIGTIISFYKAYSGTVSGRPVTGTSYYDEEMGPTLPTATVSFDLRDFRCFGNTGLIYDNEISATSVYGDLIITHRDCDPILISYEKDIDTYIAEKLILKIRDLTGIASPKEDTYEGTPEEWTALNFLSEAKYNLYNQGWTDERIVAYQNANSLKLPANTKQWWYGKDSNGDFDTDVLGKVDFGSSLAPKGRFIVEAFYQDRATAVNEQGDYSTDEIVSDPGWDGAGGSEGIPRDYRDLP